MRAVIFSVLDEVPMGEFEDVSCIISMVFDDDETEYFVVGSTYVQDEVSRCRLCLSTLRVLPSFF